MSTKKKGKVARRASGKAPTKPAPREARTFGQTCDMPRDNVSWGEYWMLADVLDVTIAKQKRGERATASITIPKATLSRFVDWYNTGVWGRTARKPATRARAKSPIRRAPSGGSSPRE